MNPVGTSSPQQFRSPRMSLFTGAFGGPKDEVVAQVALLFMLLGLHTGVSIAPKGNMLVPFVVTGLAAGFAAWFFRKRISTEVLRTLGLVAFLVATFGFLHAIFGGYPIRRLTASVQFLYSLGIGYAFFLCSRQVKPARLSAFFWLLAFALLVGSVLEIAGIIKPASDAFRLFANNWRPIYWADLRDIVEYGGIRPKVFGQEPSVLGISISVCITLGMLSYKPGDTTRLMIALAMCIAGFAFVRSPTIIVAFATCLMYYFAMRIDGLSSNGRISGIFSVVAVVVCLLIPSTLMTINGTIGGTRFTHSGSFFGRLVAPLLVTEKVLARSPVIGLGLGGWENARPDFYDVYGNEGSGYNIAFQFAAKQTDVQLVGPDLRYLITNVFWEYWLFFGFGGGAALAFALARLMRDLHVWHPGLAVGATAFFCQTIGGVNTPTPWVALFGLAAATSAFSRAIAPRVQYQGNALARRLAAKSPTLSRP